MYRIEDFPNIQKNFFLNARDIGASRKLCGDVGVMVFFLQRRSTEFSQKTQDQFRSAMRTAARWLEDRAKDYGVYLKIKPYDHYLKVPENTDPQMGYELIKQYLYGKSADDAQNYYEERLNLDEAPFIIVFDQIARSFAVHHRRYWTTFEADEICVLFKSFIGFYEWTTIAHEILHQFGAFDYYFPEKIRDAARYFFKDSIMGVGRTDRMDDLTAYLVGWKDTISDNTYHFLNSTMWLTKEIHTMESRRN